MEYRKLANLVAEGCAREAMCPTFFGGTASTYTQLRYRSHLKVLFLGTGLHRPNICLTVNRVAELPVR